MNAFTSRIGIEHPIVQGPFGGGLSSVRLAAAVSNAGGLGSFGAHHLSPNEMREVIHDLQRATAKPCNINLWVSRHDAGAEVMTSEHHARGLRQFAPIYERLGIAVPPIEPPDDFTFEQQVEVILELRPQVFSFVFGIPNAEILLECAQRGILTVGAATTLEEAAALDEAGVDMIVATGSDAGGHRPSFLRPAEDSLTGTLSLVPQVRKVTRRPVIAAGGIAEAHGVRAAFQLGADAVQIGTAFLACEESNCPPLHREALFTPAAARTRLSRRFTGRLARFMNSALLEELERSAEPALPFPLQAAFNRPVKAEGVKRNQADLLPLYAGQAAPLIQHRRAAELMRELIRSI
ncbi:MAG: nitronate monooxygenase [Verrucomicrobiaceae bacterium]